MPVYLLDESLSVEIFYEEMDCDYQDNICIKIIEDCPSIEKLFRVEESNIFITAKQSRKLAQILLQAAEESENAC